MSNNYKINILLINPPRVSHHPVIREERFEHKDFNTIYPPLTLLTTAAILKETFKDKVSLKLIDAMGFDLNISQIKNDIIKFNPQIIISRFAFDCANEDLTFLEEVKALVPHAKMIVRNKIFSDVENLLIPYLYKFKEIDFFSLFEQEFISTLQVSAIIDGKTPCETMFLNQNEILYGAKLLSADKDRLLAIKIPIPAYELLDGQKSWPYKTELFTSNFTLISSSRGCPYSCTFCAYANKKWIPRPPDDVVKEIEFLYFNFNITNFVFFDETISVDRKRVLEIFQRIIDKKIKIKFAICTRIDHVDEVFLTLAKNAGLIQISFGMESGNDDLLKSIQKNVLTNSAKTISSLCKKLKIKFIGLFIIGLPGETKESILNTIDFAIKLNPDYVQFASLIPFPNTPLFKWYKENNFLKSEDFKFYNPLNLVPLVRTKDLSYEQLQALISKAYQKFLLRPSYIFSQLSLWDWRWNIKGAIIFIKKIAGVFTKYVR